MVMSIKPGGHLSFKMQIPKPQKTAGIQDLDARLVRVHSVYVRIRDADKKGLVPCITCRRLYHWKVMQAGHYIKRTWSKTRFHDKNVNAQCEWCNTMKEGNNELYELRLDQKYGAGTARELEAMKFEPIRLDRGWYLTMIDHYRDKIKAIRKEKNILV
jgi:hypothetical protein